MKSRLLIVLFVISILFPISNIFAPPTPNEWPGAPYCPGGCSFDHLKQRWSEYYDYKGSEGMEVKKNEMLSSIDNGTLNEWLDVDPTRAHSNVHTYYFYQGEVLNRDGKSIDDVTFERFFSDVQQNLRNNHVPLGQIYIDFTFLLVLIVGIIIGVIFVIWRKRK